MGYGHNRHSLEAFLGSMGSMTSPKTARNHALGFDEDRICLGLPLHAFPRTTNAWDHLPSCVPPLLITHLFWYWNINQLCIDYAYRPRLSSRLTLGGLAFPRNPWVFGGGVSHSSLATYASILTRTSSTERFTPPLRCFVRRSPTTP